MCAFDKGGGILDTSALRVDFVFSGTGEGAGECGTGGAAVLWGLRIAVRAEGGKEEVRGVFHGEILAGPGV